MRRNGRDRCDSIVDPCLTGGKKKFLYLISGRTIDSYDFYCFLRKLIFRIFGMKVGIHRGSSLRPYLFSPVTDELTKGRIHDEAPWSMLFADDVVLGEASTNALEGKLERWRELLEKSGLKTSRPKTEFVEFGYKNEVRENESDRNATRSSTY